MERVMATRYLAAGFFVMAVASGCQAHPVSEKQCTLRAGATALIDVVSDSERRELERFRFEESEPLFVLSESIVVKARRIAGNCARSATDDVAVKQKENSVLSDDTWAIRALVLLASQKLRREDENLTRLVEAYAVELLDKSPVEAVSSSCGNQRTGRVGYMFDPANIWRGREVQYVRCADGRLLIYLAERGWHQPSPNDLAGIEAAIDDANRRALPLRSATQGND